jgi:hypothetical protein
MIVSEFVFRLIITIALAITIVSPIVLIVFWIRDWKGKRLW